MCDFYAANIIPILWNTSLLQRMSFGGARHEDKTQWLMTQLSDIFTFTNDMVDLILVITISLTWFIDHKPG